jgi:pimeloyl-ACP methyl ester carboxylesterase
MKKIYAAATLFILLLASCSTTGKEDGANEQKVSFSFDEMVNAGAVPLGEPSYIDASDGVKLAYYTFQAREPIAALIFVHGGGAYGGSGYQHLAARLRENYNVSVYLPDLRGHGNSGGPRGDAPSANQVLKDLDLMIDVVRAQSGETPLYLGGHSSGGGLVLNYLSNYNDANIRGYFFVSPHLGYKSKTERAHIKYPFTKVKTGLFVLNGISQGKLHGNTPAVFFNYPENVLQETPLLITSITVNMSLAMTPNNPQRQFAGIGKPFSLFIGGEDELFVPEKVLEYGSLPNENIRNISTAHILAGEKHLSILLAVDELIGGRILAMNN